ncbi:MAG: CRTAC1 family protein [Acidobacteriota bacterium]
MTSGAKQIVLTVLLLLLLCVPLAMRRLGKNETALPRPGTPAGEGARSGFALRDVAKEWGLAFQHRAPVLDPKLDPIMPMVASMGASVSVVDFDRDGRQDLYVTSSAEGSQNALFRNAANGKFEDVAGTLGVASLNEKGTGASMGSVWGDYDNDGFEDLLLYKWGRPELFHNDGGKGFTRVTEKAGLPPRVNAGCAIWLDYDKDGWLDALIAGYWSEAIDLWHLDTTKIMAESFEYANNGGRKYLLHNRGDGTFEEVAEKLGVTSHRWTLAIASGDLRHTGWPDIFLANDYGVSELYANQEGKGFSEIGVLSGVAEAPKSGMNASFGDVMNDGKLSIYVSNISEEGVLLQGNNLWFPAWSTDKGEVQYENRARGMGVELGGWSFGAQWGDLDLDGNLDLYLANGYVSADPKESYWYDFAQIAGGHTRIIGDAASWPAMRGRSLSGFQPKHLWLNDGQGRFREVAQSAGARDTYDGRAVALADLDGNGTLEVIVANQNGPLVVYDTAAPAGRHWVGFQLEGRASNRSAIGAQVRLYRNGRVQLQEVYGGCGYSAENQRWIHFGLGADPRIEKVVITWPSGKEQEIASPAAGTIHLVKEPA